MSTPTAVLFKAENIVLGRIDGAPYGRKRALTVTASVTITRQEQSASTIHHEQIDRPINFSLTCGVWLDRSLRSMEQGGTSVQPLRDLTEYRPGFDAEKVTALADLAPWHLNTLTAGCAHQRPVRIGRQISLALTKPCPQTGYRYGKDWLVTPLPSGFVPRLLALFDQIPCGEYYAHPELNSIS